MFRSQTSKLGAYGFAFACALLFLFRGGRLPKPLAGRFSFGRSPRPGDGS